MLLLLLLLLLSLSLVWRCTAVGAVTVLLVGCLYAAYVGGFTYYSLVVPHTCSLARLRVVVVALAYVALFHTSLCSLRSLGSLFSLLRTYLLAIYTYVFDTYTRIPRRVLLRRCCCSYGALSLRDRCRSHRSTSHAFTRTHKFKFVRTAQSGGEVRSCTRPRAW